MRNRLFAIAIAAAAAGSTAAVAQQTYPTKEVRLVVPFPASGGGADLAARLLAEGLKAAWGQPVVVENVPGASGTIGVGKVAKAAPDGYTLVMSGDAAIVVAPSLFKSLAYDPAKDLAPITQVTRTPNILVVNKESGPKSLAELVASAKANPGKVTFNSTGYGTSQHMGIEQLQRLASIKVLHAPKNGPTAPEILSGQVTATFMNITLALPLVQAGNVRALGVSGATRSPSAPDIPTIAEQGYAGFDAVAWFGVLAPAGTPEPIVRQIHAGVGKAFADAQVRKRLTDLGFEMVTDSTPQSFAAFIKGEIPRIGELVKTSGIKLD